MNMPVALRTADPALTADERLLLAVAAVPPAQGALCRAVDALALDWAGVLPLAERHGVTALLAHACLALGDDVLPADRSATLDRSLRQAAGTAAWRRAWCCCVLSALAEASIPVIVLKGAYLAEAIYPAPYLRPMADLDLLVRPEHHQAARAALARLGYAVVEDFHYGDAFNQAHGCHTQMAAPARRALPVELHWDMVMRLERRAEPDLSRLWRQARPVVLDGVPALALAPEDLLLHLCIHLASADHCFGRLIWFSDLDAVIRHPDIRLDWARLVQSAIADRAVTVVYAALRVCRALLGTPVPESVLLALAPPPPARRVVDALVTPERILRGFSDRQRLLAKYALLDSWPQRARLLRDHLLPEASVVRAYVGLGAEATRGAVAVAYGRHLGRVARRFAGRLLPADRRPGTP